MIQIGEYLNAAPHLFLGINTLMQILIYCTFAESLTEQVCNNSYQIYIGYQPQILSKYIF